LYGHRQIHGVEAGCGELLVARPELLALAEGSGALADALLGQVLAPQVGTAVGVRDVEQGHSLQVGTIGQVQSHAIAL